MSTDRGTSLIEALVATSLLVTLVSGVGHLLLSVRRLSSLAERVGTASLVAQDRIEGLRAAAFAYDLSGMPTPSPAFGASPADALDRDVSGHADIVDVRGRPTDEDDAGAPAFVRRWAITPVNGEAPESLAIEVCVFAAPVPSSAHPLLCLSTIRTRQP